MISALPYLITFALGVILGGYIVFKFNPDDLTINGKNKVKKGGQIDYKANVDRKKRKFFNRKNK